MNDDRYYNEMEKSLARERQREYELHVNRAAELRRSEDFADRLSGIVGASYYSAEKFLEGRIPSITSPAWDGGEKNYVASQLAEAARLTGNDRQTWAIRDGRITVQVSGYGYWWWSFSPEGEKKFRRQIEDQLRKGSKQDLVAAARALKSRVY